MWSVKQLLLLALSACGQGRGRILTDNCRSMKSARLVQWLHVRLNLLLISDKQMIERLGVKLCMSEQVFDSVYDEHGR
jgi:hypothetical protein